MDAIRFDGQVVLITGGARGMGLAHAELLASRGAAVLISDVGNSLYGDGEDAAIVEQAVAGIRAKGGRAEAHCADLMQEENARGAVDRAVECFGRIDAIVHNAGFTLGARSFEDEALERLDKQLAVNTRAAYAMVQQAWPRMQAQGSGSIVLVGSGAMYGLPQSTPYSTAKASYIGLGRALADEGRDCGIRVNTIAPTGASRMSDSLPASAFHDWFDETMRPEYVSPTVAWLVHPACKITGQVLLVGGGRVARMRMAETIGYVRPGHTIEELAANEAEIMDDSGMRIIDAASQGMDIAMELLGFDPPEGESGRGGRGRPLESQG